jgi:hypothetical protein
MIFVHVDIFFQKYQHEQKWYFYAVGAASHPGWASPAVKTQNVEWEKKKKWKRLSAAAFDFAVENRSHIPWTCSFHISIKLNCGAQRHHYSMFGVGRSMLDIRSGNHPGLSFAAPTGGLQPASSIQHPVSSIEYPASS